MALSLFWQSGPPDCVAQDLLDIYREGRVRALSMSVQGVLLPLRPPENLGRAARDLEHWPTTDSVEIVADPVPQFRVTRFQKVPKLGRAWFRGKFPNTNWVYEGSNRISPLDTMYTRELRARLQAHFGSPTQTLPDHGFLRTLELDDYIQFEYWFVLNDSIPLVVFDVNGPFERGVVVSTDEHFQDILSAARDAFLRRLIDDPRREPYADYYYEEELQTWFLTGFDGERYFMSAVNPRMVAPGRPVVPSG